eukprot:Hpha_TRINITY_DN16134_c1_g3::TRINITY_DN16134_c1_g3_i2::g.7061::m.7061
MARREEAALQDSGWVSDDEAEQDKVAEWQARAAAAAGAQQQGTQAWEEEEEERVALAEPVPVEQRPSPKARSADPTVMFHAEPVGEEELGVQEDGAFEEWQRRQQEMARREEA